MFIYSVSCLASFGATQTQFSHDFIWLSVINCIIIMTKFWFFALEMQNASLDDFSINIILQSSKKLVRFIEIKQKINFEDLRKL